MQALFSHSEHGPGIFAKAILTLILAMIPATISAAPNPSGMYCSELGYTVQSGECVFPDGSRCESFSFFRGECGARWSYCEQHGGHVDARTEDMGSYTIKYAACMFDDGSECSELAFMHQECGPSECGRWSGSGCAEVMEPSELPNPEENGREWSDDFVDPEETGRTPLSRSVPFHCSHFKRANPPLTRQVLAPNSLLTIDLCSADWMGCDWDDRAELGNPFALHQIKHKNLEKNKVKLRFSPVERFQFVMDEPGNSAITFTCRGEGGEPVRTLVAAITVDPAAVSVSLGEDGIQVMTATGEIRNFVPSSTTMPYFIKCKTLERGRKPIDRIRANLFDQFGFVLCAANWLDCDWIGQTDVSDTGIALQYDHKHIEKPALRKNPEERYWFQTVGEGSSEITFTCVGEDGEAVRTHHVNLTVGEERWAEIIPYKPKGKEDQEEVLEEYKPACWLKQNEFDRLDYVYVKESGGGLTLVPTEARVIRDWKYMDDACDPPIETDLSDHYPLLVKFSIEGPRAPSSRKELTILTYNTHLFWGIKGEVAELLEKKALIYQDNIRREAIASEIELLDADIVALQEVWSKNNQSWFANRLNSSWPYSIPFHFGIGSTSSPEGFTDILKSGLRTTPGLLLLSKLPLKNVQFREFPIFWPIIKVIEMDIPQMHDNPPQDAFARKGVFTADVELTHGGPTIRLGVSHAHTKQEVGRGKWSSKYRGTGITTFNLNGNPYIFALKDHFNEAYITRIYDYSWDFEGKRFHDAGWKDVYKGSWNSNYRAVVSFELNGHPYLFGLKGWPHNVAYISRINDDGKGWRDIHKGKWDSRYVNSAITSFELNGHPHIFALKEWPFNVAYISRINDDGMGWTDIYEGKWDSNYVAVVSFELNGHPHLFGLKGWPHNVAYISRINDDGKGWTDIYKGSWDSKYVPTAITSFQLNGHPYIFALKKFFNEAYISRINDDGKGWTDIYKGDWSSEYVAVRSFELNGHPYLFGLKYLHGEHANWTPGVSIQLPGEAFLTRIDDDGRGWQDVNNLPHMQNIIDETVREDVPAIMVGDFNVHRSNYGNMDRMFRTFGAVDSYARVHGGDLRGAETIDKCNNTLTQVFDRPTSASAGWLDWVELIGFGVDNAFLEDVANGLVCLPRTVERPDGSTAQTGEAPKHRDPPEGREIPEQRKMKRPPVPRDDDLRRRNID